MEKHLEIVDNPGPTAEKVANGIRTLIEETQSAPVPYWSDALPTELGETRNGVYFILLIGKIPFMVEVKAI